MDPCSVKGENLPNSGFYLHLIRWTHGLWFLRKVIPFECRFSRMETVDRLWSVTLPECYFSSEMDPPKLLTDFSSIISNGQLASSRSFTRITVQFFRPYFEEAFFWVDTFTLLLPHSTHLFLGSFCLFPNDRWAGDIFPEQKSTLKPDQVVNAKFNRRIRSHGHLNIHLILFYSFCFHWVN